MKRALLAGAVVAAFGVGAFVLLSGIGHHGGVRASTTAPTTTAANRPYPTAPTVLTALTVPTVTSIEVQAEQVTRPPTPATPTTSARVVRNRPAPTTSAAPVVTAFPPETTDPVGPVITAAHYRPVGQAPTVEIGDGSRVGDPVDSGTGG